MTGAVDWQTLLILIGSIAAACSFTWWVSGQFSAVKAANSAQFTSIQDSIDAMVAEALKKQREDLCKDVHRIREMIGEINDGMGAINSRIDALADHHGLSDQQPKPKPKARKTKP